MKLKSIIVEDLPVAAFHLKNCCERLGDVTVLEHFDNVKDALAFLNTSQPIDLIFLDVEMPGATGFDLLDQLSTKPQIILTTSKKEYAYDAFNYAITDFLMKPYSYERFVEAVKKVDRQLELQQKDKKSVEDIFIKSDGKLVKLNVNDILFVESMGDYVKFITNEKKYITLNTIKNVEEELSGANFIKTHRSYIVNISKVKDIVDNTLIINEHQVPISRQQKATVISKLKIV
jgi:DNA-binding LytR/AlgR family response regulator